MDYLLQVLSVGFVFAPVDGFLIRQLFEHFQVIQANGQGIIVLINGFADKRIQFRFFQVFFNVFNARSEHSTVFNQIFFSNGKLWLALGTVLAIAVASSVLLLDEGRKLLMYLARREQMPLGATSNSRHQ